MVNRSALILIHGRGGSPGDWSAFQLQLRQHIDLFPVRYLIPDAPRFPFEDEGEKDKNALSLFTAGVAELKREIQGQIERGIPASQIALVGFAQGANLVLGAAAVLDIKIAGFFVISGYCPAVIKDYLKDPSVVQATNLDTPIYHFHGSLDGAIPFEKAVTTSEFVKSLGFTKYNLIEIQDGKHNISPGVCSKLIDELPVLFS